MIRAAVLLACWFLASAAGAQSGREAAVAKRDQAKGAASQQRQRAIARCKENHGVDCVSPAGLEEWIRQERPITDRERAAAAAARRSREQRQGK